MPCYIRTTAIVSRSFRNEESWKKRHSRFYICGMRVIVAIIILFVYSRSRKR